MGVKLQSLLLLDTHQGNVSQNRSKKFYSRQGAKAQSYKFSSDKNPLNKAPNLASLRLCGRNHPLFLDSKFLNTFG
jgi:hypothetical protein